MSDAAWTGVRRAFLPVSTALLILAGAVVPLPAFIEMPGSAVGIPACITIDEEPDAAVHGDFMITTITQREATVFDLALATVVDDRRVIPRQDLLGGRQRRDFLSQQRQVFVDATERAVLVALETVGLAVRREGSGVRVVEVLDGAPADGALRAGDVITAVDGDEVRTTDDLIAAIDDGAPLTVRIERDAETLQVVLEPEVRDVDGERRAVIGVRIETRDPEIELPLDVDVNSGRVGGPSAGLMIGLAVFDLIDDDDLAAGRRIAGTGTLALDGRVGRIDNIDLKVTAALAEGADVFVAPSSQADVAAAAVPDGADLVVIGAETFEEAMSQLRDTAGDAEHDTDVAAATPMCRFATSG